MSESLFRIAARVANVWEPADLSRYDDATLTAVGTTLEREKVSLLALHGAYPRAIMDTPLRLSIERDLDRYRTQRSEFEAVRRRLAGDDVRAMLFKSVGMMPGFHYVSSNLDVLVPPGAGETARGHLLALGFVELVNVEEPKKFLFRHFPGDGPSFAFHLHETVGWGVPFVDPERMWAGARPAPDDPDIEIPGPVEALAVTLAHWFYEDKVLSLGNLLATGHALDEVGDRLDEAAALAAARGWEEGFWGALHVFDQAWTRLFGWEYALSKQRNAIEARLAAFPSVARGVVPHVRYGDDAAAVVPFMRNKVVYYRKVLRDPRRPAGAKVADVVKTLLWAVRWKLHIRSQRPILVSVSGCDGSGKSVQVARLMDAFAACDVRARRLWVRGGSSRAMSALIRVAKALAGGGPSGDRAGGEAARYRERRAWVATPARRAAYAAAYALDLVWPCVVRPRLSMLAGTVVVCDRYVDDALVDYALLTGADAARARRVPWVLRLVAWLAPRPHVRVLLDVEPEDALERKPEEGGTEHLAAARAGYLALAERTGALVLPTGEGIGQLEERLAHACLERFYARYTRRATLGNVLLWSSPRQVNPDVRRA